MTDEHTSDVAYSDEKLAQTVMGDDLSSHRGVGGPPESAAVVTS
jgi:hypothetical protein